MFRNSLEEGLVSRDWKRANVILIFQKTNRENDIEQQVGISDKQGLLKNGKDNKE